MSTHNICFCREIRKISAFFRCKKCLNCCYEISLEMSEMLYLVMFYLNKNFRNIRLTFDTSVNMFDLLNLNFKNNNILTLCKIGNVK